MEIDEIASAWTKDAKIDITDLVGANIRIPPLMAKYLNITALEKAEKRLLMAEYKKLVASLTEMFTVGPGSRAEYEQWKSRLPAKQGNLTKTELENYLASDAQVIELSLKIGAQDEKLEYLREVLICIKQWKGILENINETRRFNEGM